MFPAFWDTRLTPGDQADAGQGWKRLSDQSHSSLTQNRTKLKRLFHHPSSVIGEGGWSTKTPFWVLVKTRRPHARSWVLTNPDSRLSAHSAYTWNGWFSHSRSWGRGVVSECTLGLFLNRPLLTGALSQHQLFWLLFSTSCQCLYVSNTESHIIVYKLGRSHKTLITGSHEYLNMTLIFCGQ